MRRRAAPRLFQAGVQVCARKPQHRHEADNDGDDKSQDEREAEDSGVDIDLAGARQGFLIQAQQRIKPPEGEQHTDAARHHRQQCAFGDELPRQS